MHQPSPSRFRGAGVTPVVALFMALVSLAVIGLGHVIGAVIERVFQHAAGLM